LCTNSSEWLNTVALTGILLAEYKSLKENINSVEKTPKSEEYPEDGGAKAHLLVLAARERRKMSAVLHLKRKVQQQLNVIRKKLQSRRVSMERATEVV